MNYSKPPIRAEKTHEANENALKTLKPVFGSSKLLDIDATQIEFHLRSRLQQKRRVRRKSGIVELSHLKPASVHQEFRVLRRILGVAVKKKLVPTNPCIGVEFPVMVKGLFRPHYMTWSEQATIEQKAPAYLRAGVRYFRIYDLRSTYATRLSAGGAADEWVTQMLRQTDAKVFKKYSQMKLQMKREALKQLKRQAGDSEAQKRFDTEEDE